MPLLTTWIVAATLVLPPAPVPGPSRQIDVNCQDAGALDRAIATAKTLDEGDIYLHGVCEGNFVITIDGITLWGAISASGLAVPEGGANQLPVLEVVDAQANLRGLVVRGGGIGVLVQGWNGQVFLYQDDVDGRSAGGAGVVATRGAMAHLLHSTVRDGNIGIVAESSSELNLQGVSVHDQRMGVAISGGRSAACSNATTIANTREAGLTVDDGSDINLFDTAFRDNGQVHIHSGEWSQVNVDSGVTIGSDQDPTLYSLGAIRGATIGTYATPAIYGNASVLDGGSIQVGNAVLNGFLFLEQFAKAYAVSATITGVVIRGDGSEAICHGVTSGGASVVRRRPAARRFLPRTAARLRFLPVRRSRFRASIRHGGRARRCERDGSGRPRGSALRR